MTSGSETSGESGSEDGGDSDSASNGNGNGDDLLRLAAEQIELTKRLRSRIQQLEDERTASLAIVSTALRLPGALTTPEAYWQFLLSERDVISQIPDDRPALHTPPAAFLTNVAGFDPDFFGMSQREAEHTDPRQRLLLETAWETIERAAIAVRRRGRLHAGVFIGITADEYSDRLDPGDRIRHDAASRVSQTFGLTGPAISVDTADSSSLVALHLAAQALRRGECRYALVGGASLMFSPGPVTAHRRSAALAPDGRCKPFAASADGAGRGEGIGMALLMRLRDAEHEGRPIQAILRGTAVQHTGAPGLLRSAHANDAGSHAPPPDPQLATASAPDARHNAAPTPDARHNAAAHNARHDILHTSLADICAAQRAVISAALDDAGVAVHEVGVVETHATGSPLTDPIEIGALADVIGAAAPQRPVRALLSTLKPRLGHLDGAAGIAALIKVVLMLQHGVVPAAVPLDTGPLTEFVPWDRVRLLVPRVHTPWPIEYKRRIAGVSAFGESGTNAHAILEAYVPISAPAPSPRPAPPTTTPEFLRPLLITLSARNAASLTETVVAVSSYLVGTPPEKLASVAHTLQVGRTPFEHRVAVIGTSGSDLAEKLAVAVGHDRRDARLDLRQDAASARQHTVTLRVGSGVVRLSAAINALTAAYPLLAPVVGATGLPPAERLKRLMLHFGLRVKSERRDLASGTAVAEVAWSDRRLPLITDNTEATPAHLLHTLAALFTDGADLRLDALRQAGARIVGDLPTYSFRRKRCWIDEHTTSGGDHQPIRSFLLNELMNVLPPGKSFDPTETFIELGGDSLAAMQLTVSIEERYGVEIPLDEFNGDLQVNDLIDDLTHRVVRIIEWTAPPAAHEDDAPCPPSCLDASCPPPSTQTSYVQS